MKKLSGTIRIGALATLALGAASLASLVSLGLAQPAQPARKSPAQAAPKAAPKKAGEAPAGAVRIYSPSGEGTLDLKTGVRHLTPNVKLWQEGEDFILYANFVTHYEKDNTATARGNLYVESTDSTIIGDLLRADFNAKMMTLTGNVTMKSHGQKDGIQPAEGKTVRGEVLHKPSSLRCDRLDYDYETKQATLSGNLFMRQGENTGTCDRILFDEGKNIARLMGNVRFTDGDKQTITAPEVTIWIDDNMIRVRRPQIELPRNSEKNKGTPRKATEFGDAPRLPSDVIEGRERALPTPLPPLRSAEEPDAATPPAASATPGATPKVVAQPTPLASAPSEDKKS